MSFRRGIGCCAVAALALAGLVTPAGAQDEASIVYSAYRYAGRSAGSAIFTVAPGSERVRLTGSRSFNLQPVWSPDRTRIAYVHHARPRNPDIWLMDADGSNKVRLTRGPGDDVYPQWSPDGSHIAWVKSGRGGTGRIFVMHPDGADKMPVTPKGYRAALPVWSPDGHRVAYAARRSCDGCGDDADVYVTDGHTTSGAEIALTDNDVEDVGPAWSPDGSRIAFSREMGEGAQLFTMAADGSDQQQLTSQDGFVFLGRWSPDGSEIAFTVIVDDANFHTRLGVVTVETADERLLTDVPTGGIQPDWSPDGSRIAFLGFHSGGYNVGVIGRDGNGLQQVTTSRIDEAWLDW